MIQKRIISCNLTLPNFILKGNVSLLILDQDKKKEKAQKKANTTLQKLIDLVNKNDTLNTKLVSEYYTLLEEAEKVLEEVKILIESNDQDLDFEKVSEQIKNELIRIVAAVDTKEKESSSINQNTVMQQGPMEKLLETLVIFTGKTQNIQEENQKQMDLLTKLVEEQNQKNNVPVYQSKTIKFDIQIFKFSIVFPVLTMEKEEKKLLLEDLNLKLKELNNGRRMTGRYQLAQQIDSLVEISKKFKLDLNIGNYMLEKFFSYEKITQTTSGINFYSSEDRFEKTLTEIIKLNLGIEEISYFNYTRKLVEEYGMKFNETINQWLTRFKACTRHLKEVLNPADFINYFFIGVRKEWKKKNKCLELKIREKKDVNFTIPEELESKSESNQSERIVTIKRKNENKNNNNYFGVYNPQFSSFNKNKRKNKNKIELNENDYTNIFNLWKKNRMQFLEKRIKRDQEELEKKKEDKTMHRGKLYIEIKDTYHKKFLFLIDSGSPVHVIKKEVVDEYSIPYKEQRYKNYRGVGNDPKVDMIGVCKTGFIIGDQKVFIKFLIAKDFPVNILSWQKLSDAFGNILWMESGKGRLIAIGTTQFIEGRDGIFRPRRKFDMAKVIKKIDDSKENQFELDNNLFQMSDTTSILDTKIKEQNQEIEQMKIKIQELEHLSKVMKPIVMELPIVNKEIQYHYEIKQVQHEKIYMEKMESEEDILLEAEELLATMRDLHEKVPRVDKEQFEEQVRKVREKYSQFKDEKIEDMLKEFVEDVVQNKESAKEEFKKLLEEINLVRYVTKANKKETFKHKESKEHRKKLKKEEEKKRICEVKKMEEFICNIRDWTEDEFDDPNHKPLLDEWNRKKEEERKMELMYKGNFTIKKKIKEITDVKLDENGIATFTCILESKFNKDPQLLTEDMMWGGSIKVNKFMKEHGYIRKDNISWTKIPDNQLVPDPKNQSVTLNNQTPILNKISKN